MWKLRRTTEFHEWFESLDRELKEDATKYLAILRNYGPSLGRPHVDTLKGSSIPNLKELRFNSGNKVIRIFFVFDPEREGILLTGGNKAGSGDKSFYKKMIEKSEKIYFRYLENRRSRKKQ